mgnify:CR=1 FL=1
MSKSRFLDYLNSGVWDNAHVGGGSDNFGNLSEPSIKDQLRGNANAYSVSQYFTGAGGTVQIRTSGYSKFADLEIDTDVLSGSKTITATGILTMYQGGVQLVLRDQNDIVIE